MNTETDNLTIAQIGSMDECRVFTLNEARQLLAIVKPITLAAFQELDPVKTRMENMLPSDPRLKIVERKYEQIVRRWVTKMQRLGLVVGGLWILNFDTGDGYLSWQHPEKRIGWYFNYDQGFADRRPLQQVIDELLPEWV